MSVETIVNNVARGDANISAADLDSVITHMANLGIREENKIIVTDDITDQDQLNAIIAVTEGQYADPEVLDLALNGDKFRAVAFRPVMPEIKVPIVKTDDSDEKPTPLREDEPVRKRVKTMPQDNFAPIGSAAITNSRVGLMEVEGPLTTKPEPTSSYCAVQ